MNLLLLALVGVSALPDGLCLVNGTVEADRKNLTYARPDGTMYNGPIRDLNPQWASGAVIHQIAKVLLEEVLGYTYSTSWTWDPDLLKDGCTSDDPTRCKTATIWYTHQMVLAPSGCKEWWNNDPTANNGKGACFDADQYDEWMPAAHLGLEGWSTANKAVSLVPGERRALQLTKHKYRGIEALFLPNVAKESALEDHIVLSTYEGWNVTQFPNIVSHFDNIAVAMPKILAALDGGVPNSVKDSPAGNSMATYRSETGDNGMNCYDSTTDKLTAGDEAACAGDYWVSPACRANPGIDCVPVTTCSGWGEAEFRQYAAFFDWPIAIADYGWGNYVKATVAAKVAFYWWYPDATFGSVAPRVVAMPPWNMNEHQAGIYRTAMPDTDLTRFVWSHMSKADDNFGRNIVSVLDAMTIYESDLAAMLEEMAAESRTAAELACEFLQNNRNRWGTWIPDLEAQKKDCKPGSGYDSALESCVPCAGGEVSEYKDVAAGESPVRICRTCIPGMMCSAGTVLESPCSPGAMCPDAGTEHATPCPTGQQQPNEGQTECIPCEAGTFADQSGTVTCGPCTPGHYTSTKGTTKCLRCTAKEYQDVFGETSCKRCKDGFISLPAATDASECVCAQDSFYSESTDTCIECGVGLVCLQGREVPFLAEGFYGEAVTSQWEGEWVLRTGTEDFWEYTTDSNDVRVSVTDAALYKESQVWSCPFGIKACSGSKQTTKDGFIAESARKNDVCDGGLVAVNGCARCPDGSYFSADDVQCNVCGGGDRALYPIIFLLGITAMLSLYKLTKFHASQKLTNMLMFSCSASLLVNFFQLLGVIGFYSVDFPNLLHGFFDFFKLFIFDLDVLRASCATGADFASRFLTRVVSPIVFMGVFFFTYPVSILVEKFTQEKIGRMDFNNVLNTAGLITNAGYIALCKISMQYYECREQPSAPATVNAYPDVNCQSADHSGLMGLAICMTILYGAGIYVISVYLCFTAPERMLESSNFRRRTRFLVGRWNPGRWYWGPVLQTRNLIVSLVAVGYPSDGVMQLIVTGAIVVLYTAAQSSMEPWRDLFLNITDTVLGLAIVLTCMFGTLLVTDVGKTDPRASGATAYLLLIFTGSFMALGWAAIRALMAFIKPGQAKKKDRKYTTQATKVLLLQTKRLYQLCQEGSDEEDIGEALASYLTVSEQKQIFKLGKVLLHEMCGVKYKSDVDFKRLMINKIEDPEIDIMEVNVDVLNTEGDDLPAVKKPSRVSAMSRLGGMFR